ncbi:hypothetical protein ANN_26275 [Periplaneta americana]|uniref:Uncharacterized protein n=1 Tax=Periplaneta americana TaxID=6978 RepID=A0ABQ8S5W6_PERAM|nr:hypothetical protein ANN_26275 [Periplaneta americana]
MGGRQNIQLEAKCVERRYYTEKCLGSTRSSGYQLPQFDDPQSHDRVLKIVEKLPIGHSITPVINAAQSALYENDRGVFPSFVVPLPDFWLVHKALPTIYENAIKVETMKQRNDVATDLILPPRLVWTTWRFWMYATGSIYANNLNPCEIISTISQDKDASIHKQQKYRIRFFAELISEAPPIRECFEYYYILGNYIGTSTSPPPPEFWAEARKFRNVQTTDAAEYYHNGLQQEFFALKPPDLCRCVCLSVIANSGSAALQHMGYADPPHSRRLEISKSNNKCAGKIGSVSYTKRLLNRLGFHYRKTNDGRKYLMEQNDILAARLKFLRKMHMIRSSGDIRPTFYLDETYPPYLEVVSSISNLKMRHAMGIGTHNTWGRCIPNIILKAELEKPVFIFIKNSINRFSLRHNPSILNTHHSAVEGFSRFQCQRGLTILILKDTIRGKDSTIHLNPSSLERIEKLASIITDGTSSMVKKFTVGVYPPSLMIIDWTKDSTQNLPFKTSQGVLVFLCKYPYVCKPKVTTGRTNVL